ncbi:MAG: hypothetical protein ACI9HY_003254 [Planctomycetaceae bacterium]|jgi:hypothetical protein
MEKNEYRALFDEKNECLLEKFSNCDLGTRESKAAPLKSTLISVSLGHNCTKEKTAMSHDYALRLSIFVVDAVHLVGNLRVRGNLGGR